MLRVKDCLSKYDLGDIKIPHGCEIQKFTTKYKGFEIFSKFTELYDIHRGGKNSKPCSLGSEFTVLIFTSELSGVKSETGCILFSYVIAIQVDL